MNYIKYKNKYPLTLTHYFEWTVEDLAASNSFDNFLEYFFNGGIESGSDGGEYYYSQLHIDKVEFIKILQVQFPELYDKYTEEIVIDLVENRENAYKCAEYLLLNGHKQ